jgi:hypothetical protein
VSRRDRVNFGAPRSGGSLGGLQWRQLGLLVAGGAWALLALRLTPGVPGLVVAVAGGGGCTAAALLRPAGRLPLDWGIVAGHFAERRARRQTKYRRLCDAERRRLPDHLTGTTILEVATDRGPVGVIRDRRRMVAVMRVDPVPGALASDDEAATARAAWGGVLAAIARPNAGIARIQWTVRSRPLGPQARSDFLPAGLPQDVPAHLAEGYADLVAETGDSAREHVLTVAVGAEFRRGPGTDAVRRAIEGADEICAGIHGAGLGTAGLLEPAQIAAELRGAIDLDHGDRFSAGPGVLLPDPTDFSPMGLDEEWSRLHCDGRWHAIFWISQWPRGDAEGDVLAPLVLAGPPGRTVTVVMEPRDPARAVRDAEQARLRDDADDDLRERTGFVRSVRRARQQAAVSAAEHELADGHAAYRFVGYLGVSAASADALDDACREAIAAAAMARCELRRLWGEQTAGLACVLPMCRGLA